MFVTFEIATERSADLRFEEFPRRAHAVLKERIEDLTSQLHSMVASAAPRRTGRLAASIESRVVDYPDRITGYVKPSSDFAKAAALEYGSHRTVQVKAHRERLDHVYARPLASSINVTVSAHARRTNVAEHRYLRGPLDAIRPLAIAELRQALAEAAAAS